MSFRFMRLILMFDLPTFTASDKRIYRKFHKTLIKEGFFMFQYSIYTKLAINKTVSQQIINKINKIKPERGFISILEITEKQFNDIKFISGSRETNILNSTEKVTFYNE